MRLDNNYDTDSKEMIALLCCKFHRHGNLRQFPTHVMLPTHTCTHIHEINMSLLQHAQYMHA